MTFVLKFYLYNMGFSMVSLASYYEHCPPSLNHNMNAHHLKFTPYSNWQIFILDAPNAFADFNAFMTRSLGEKKWQHIYNSIDSNNEKERMRYAIEKAVSMINKFFTCSSNFYNHWHAKDYIRTYLFSLQHQSLQCFDQTRWQCYFNHKMTSLGSCLINASKLGFITIINTIISNGNFSSLPPYIIGEAVHLSVKFDNDEIFYQLAQSSQFNIIPRRYLEYILILLASKGDLKKIQWLKFNCPKFSDITIEGYIRAYNSAKAHAKKSVMEWFEENTHEIEFKIHY
jgi:hypothetical protein